MRRSIWLPVLALVCGVSTALQAQDFFRDLGTSRSSGGIGPDVTVADYNYANTAPSEMRRVTPVTAAEENDVYNFALGPVRFGIAAGVGLEFNDNIALSDNDRQSDIIFRPILDLDVAWPISDNTTLKLSLGASYAKYFDHSTYDSASLLVSPTSALELGIDIGVVHVTLRDRFSYQEEPYDVAVLSNVADYRRYENQAGLEVDWPINEKLNFGIGYDHFNLWSNDNDVFSTLDHSIDTIYTRPTYQITPGIKAGIFGSFSFIEYDDSARTGATAYMIGPTVDIQINDHIALYAEVGYQAINNDGVSHFDEAFFSSLSPSDQALFADGSDAGGLYFKFEISQTVSPLFEHALSASKTTELGFSSNTYDLYHIEYSANFKGIRNTEIGPLLFYEHYTTSGSIGETADRYGAAIGVRYHLTNSITLGLDYRFLLKNSNQPDADYYQNIVFLSAYYRF